MPLLRPKKVVVPNKYGQDKADDGFEEVEIAAQISLPQDGGWAWLVLFASFMCYLIVDGVIYTFGSVLEEISKELNTEDAVVALVNSVACGLYMMCAPLASALINRFGFRVCGMTGSIICSTGLYCSNLSTNFASLFIFNGVVTGFGCSLINMSAGLVVGFYFEKFRAIAIAISTCGTSVGMALFFPIDVQLVKLNGWRSVMLMNSGLHGIIFFLAMTFRPLPSLIVTNVDIGESDRARTVTYLPSRSTAGLRLNASASERVRATNVERMFGTVSNTNFPTAAAVVDLSAGVAVTKQPGPSSSTAPSTPRIAISTRGMSERQLKQLHTFVSRPNMQDIVEIDTSLVREEKHRGCCGRLCNWEPHQPEARPMYRDDAFYSGDIKKLDVYRKSVADLSPENKTGLEYQMAVTRAVTVNDLEEKRGICTIACRRVLATMMDVQVLKKRSFQLYLFSGLSIYSGFMIPYVYLKDRNMKGGIPENHCDTLISVIAGAGAFGRIGLSVLAMKVDPVFLSAICAITAGLTTVFSGISYSIAFQYGYSFIFGVAASTVNGLRSLVLVKVYGLEKLTSTTGMYFLALGIGNVISTPLGGVLKNHFGYDATFYVCGGFFLIAGLAIFLMMIFVTNEKKAELLKLAQKPAPEKAKVKPSKHENSVKISEPQMKR